MNAAGAGLPPLSLYLHFPWCVSKCPYCDFNSHALREALPEDRYIDTLLLDVAAQSPRVAGREIVSVFMGGGTPSLFGPRALDRLLQEIRRKLPFAADAEITLEANPATVERGRFAEYRAIGINRVSLGAQSFDDETLKALGRIHTPADVLRAAEELHACGLANFNLDLMYALPSQPLAGALADVTAALALAPAHLSHYQLTLEPGTLFAAQPPPLPDEDLAWAMQLECQALLGAYGFDQYEVSAYARGGRQCRHNLNYWTFGDYLGIGAGAHGKVTAPGASGWQIERSVHLREPRRYLASAQAAQWRGVPVADIAFEFMMNALRLTGGFTPQQLEDRTGLPLEALAPKLESLVIEGLMEPAAGGWRASPRGFQYLNEVVARFLPGPDSRITTGS
ncbi:MAG: radical SAM family heme chaperone HemW [Pseudomonadota bacterium]